MKGKLLWSNSTLSGLCDRLMDLILMSSLARIIDKDLYLKWRQIDEFGLSDYQKETWAGCRWTDYLIENVQNYFELPENINFINSNTEFQNGLVIDKYLGGIYSPKTFYQLLNLNIDYEQFYNVYRDTIGQFKPRQKLLNLVDLTEQIDLAVHLRRTDKVNLSPNGVEIHNDDLQKLNDITLKCIMEEMEKTKDKKKVFICSDDDKAKLNLQSKIQDKCIIVDSPKVNYEFEKTYVDLFMLSQSKKIIMSQKHSNFSIFSSLIRETELIYFYKDNNLISNSSLPFYTYYN
jgi:hypothetical protein